MGTCSLLPANLLVFIARSYCLQPYGTEPLATSEPQNTTVCLRSEPSTCMPGPLGHTHLGLGVWEEELEGGCCCRDRVLWHRHGALSSGMANFLLTSGLDQSEFGTASEEGSLAGSSDLWSSNGPPFPSRSPRVQCCWFPRGNSGVFFPWEGALGEPVAGGNGRPQPEFLMFRDSAWVQTGGTHHRPLGITAQPCARQQLMKCGRGRSPALQVERQQSQEDVSSSPKSCADQITLSCFPAKTPIPAWSWLQSVLMYLVAFVELTHRRGQM